jgi:hypothetical protein
VLSATMSPASTTTAKPSAPSPATTPLSATLEATDPSERAVCKSVHRTPGLHQRTMEARFRAGPVMYTSTKHEVQEAVQLQMPQPDQHGPSYKDENVFISDTDSDSPPPLGQASLSEANTLQDPDQSADMSLRTAHQAHVQHVALPCTKATNRVKDDSHLHFRRGEEMILEDNLKICSAIETQPKEVTVHPRTRDQMLNGFFIEGHPEGDAFNGQYIVKDVVKDELAGCGTYCHDNGRAALRIYGAAPGNHIELRYDKELKAFKSPTQRSEVASTHITRNTEDHWVPTGTSRATATMTRGIRSRCTTKWPFDNCV